MSEISGGSSKAVVGDHENNPANNNPGRPEGNRRPFPLQGIQVYHPPWFEVLCTYPKKHVYNVSQVTNNYDLFLNTTQAIRE